MRMADQQLSTLERLAKADLEDRRAAATGEKGGHLEAELWKDASSVHIEQAHPGTVLYLIKMLRDLHAKLAEALSIIADLQWEGGEHSSYCLVCHGSWPDHARDCRIREALGAPAPVAPEVLQNSRNEVED